ncbi:hypothetical protein HOLleu_21005 [Holothuria leucospilota]|uniref:HYR domain-containing protein n=1 Tax=Holothuria leucospilota TaxID=206669 RepID=A0A9Q1BVU2_HOLLE|nr:hypothetical protein HOLleu_21005 [Holothuria leucospilota]
MTDIAKNTPPTVPTCPDSPVSVTSPGSSGGATVRYDPITCCDVEQGNITAQCNGPVSGSLFPTGKTSITCVCSDDGGLSSSCIFIVDVRQGECTEINIAARLHCYTNEKKTCF